ncbi:TPA: phage tail protein, partial [Mannheimia haemolytica]|nr:phage tail protein [Mannheimia haemolytica]
FDKWALYDVSRYCDQLVPDGMGGQEPRFTCDVWLTEVKTAYDLLNDFCSVFRAIPIWTGTEVSVIIDRPRDPVWTYTNANVVGGFERSYSARKSRHNAVQVTYSDKTNGYESAIEYVSDDEEIKKHGLNLSQITAFGCTSRGQAHRTGKWILETEKREKETITFTVGREGLMHLPGDIIRVADSHYAGTEIGGRVLAINGRKVTLDREISIDNASYFTYINGEATHSTIKIQS